MRVLSISFSAHADARGILKIIENSQAKSTMFVHGELSRMKIISKIVE